MQQHRQQDSMKITIKIQQSLFDIAVEHCGAVEAVLDLAFANNISVTDAIAVGTELMPVAVQEKNKKRVELFGNLLNKVGTALNEGDESILEDVVPARVGPFDYTYDDTFDN